MEIGNFENSQPQGEESMPEKIKPPTRAFVPEGKEELSEEWNRDDLTEDMTLAEDVAHYEEDGRESTRRLNHPSSVPPTRVASPAEKTALPTPSKPWWKKLI